jgi:hypothetical protein
MYNGYRNDYDKLKEKGKIKSKKILELINKNHSIIIETFSNEIILKILKYGTT